MMIDFFHLTFKIETLSNGLWNIKAAPWKKWTVGSLGQNKALTIVWMVDYKIAVIKGEEDTLSLTYLPHMRPLMWPLSPSWGEEVSRAEAQMYL